MTENEKDMLYISKLYENMSERSKIALMMLAEDLTTLSKAEINEFSNELDRLDMDDTLDTASNII